MVITTGLLQGLACSLLAVQTPAYVTQVVGPAKKVEVELTLKVHVPRMTASEWIVFTAKPPNIAGQTIKSSSLEPGGKAAHEWSPEKRPVLKAFVPANNPSLKKDITIKVKHEVVLLERRLVEASKMAKRLPVAMTAELSEEEWKRAIAPTSLIDFKSAGFQKWLDQHKLRRQKGEHEVDFARRVFLAVVQNFKYEYRTEMDRHADAICKAGKSDCGGLSVVFVGAMRANKIPTRLRVGRWAESQRPGEKAGDPDDGQEHVIAEFYSSGAGWVVVDCASGVVHDKTPGKLDYFGRFRADFITLHIDHDMVVDTVRFGKETVPWMQGISYWVSGAGDLKGSTEKETWRVRSLP
jgi:transglutaminase-like putative cysteine protease